MIYKLAGVGAPPTHRMVDDSPPRLLAASLSPAPLRRTIGMYVAGQYEETEEGYEVL